MLGQLKHSNTWACVGYSHSNKHSIFLCQLAEEEFKETVPFTVASQINLTKGVKEVYSDKFKALQEENEEDNRGCKEPGSLFGRINIVK